jgi:hypothetical protein
MREKLVVAFAQIASLAGAPSFEEGMSQVRELVGKVTDFTLFVNNVIQSVRTVEDVGEMFNSQVSISPKEETLLLFAMENLPQILWQALTTVAEKAKSSLPAPHGGRRPAFTAEESQEVLDYVSQLHRKGAPLHIAKGRAAQRFDCSRRTIQRLWTSRESVPLEPRPTIQEVISGILKAGEADGWQVPADFRLVTPLK